MAEAPTPDSVIADILAVATREFAQHGLGGARVERIVAGTRTSKRMIYYHFGSKEGLYRAVLEQAFRTARFREVRFDATVGTPQECLTRFVENAFDTFSQSPDFVRLLTLENLSGAPYIKGSDFISELNQHGLTQVATILRRGQKDGSIRDGISALDVYINLVGMCYYHVANRAGYVAGFRDETNAMIVGQAFEAQRKNAIVEAVLRYVNA